jgi:histone acetyltransferase (RNA polymerase elongator complex component)
MSECKHGLKHGCVYCHGTRTASGPRSLPKRPTRASRLSEQMNDRMTALNRRLRELRRPSPE